jgi:protein-S-isoprenylcysteine O-methyltransferase Ste14
MAGVYVCIAVCIVIWVVNGICIIHGIREHFASEIYMHTGLGTFLTLLAIELIVGIYGAWSHLDIFWLAVIGWILYIPSVVLLLSSMIALKRKGKSKGADFTDTTSFINSGIYKIVRQPMTLGLAVWSVALVFVFQSIIAIVLGLTSLFCFWMSARKESEYNIKKFGDAYKEYMKKVPMWNIFSRG